MYLIPKKRPPGSAVELTKHTIGNALVVHAEGTITPEARVLALSVAEDHEHDLVVVDLPPGVPIMMWDSVAALLPKRRQGVRLVVGGRSREATALAGQWLSERLGRPVIAPDGALRTTMGGGLFVNSGQSSGWVRFHPGRPPTWEAKRFPRPVWDREVISEATPTSARCVAEPIPGGLWIRPTGDDALLESKRAWLIQSVPCQADLLTVVLGVPGGAMVSLDDAARAWMRIPEDIRPMVRFAQFGPIAQPAAGPVGQHLAQLLGERVAFFAGLPFGASNPPDVLAVRQGGELGWPLFARELGYQPVPAGAAAAVPTLLSHRVPVPGAEEVAPAVYWCAPDAVVEVVQGGLWLRPPQDVSDADLVRSAPLDPTVNRIVFEATDEMRAGRMRWLAEDLAGRLDHTTRRFTKLVTVSDLIAGRASAPVVGRALGYVNAPPPAQHATQARPTERLAEAAPHRSVEPHVELTERIQPEHVAPVEVDAAPESSQRQRHVTPGPAMFQLESQSPGVQPSPDVPVPVPAVLPAEHSVSLPSTTVFDAEPPVPIASDPRPVDDEQPRWQPTPATDACALTPLRGADEERAWLRRNLGAQYGNLANSVARVLSEHPGFQGALTKSKEQVLTDAVAVRLYLSEQGESVDGALRTAAVGPHVPFARCVVAGLSRLPSHRGAALLPASPTAAQLAMYQERGVFTDWGFVHALNGRCGVTESTCDVLLWAMSARRTTLLEPDTEHTRDRVLFVPGTSFKVLRTTAPGNGTRGQILLRELASGEIDEEGRVDQTHAALDELAITSLLRQADRWSQEDPVARIAPAEAGRFRSLPGMV